MDKIDFIESMKVLEYKPSDIIVMKCSQKLSFDNRLWILESVQKVLDPINKRIKVMILEDGMDIGVLREGNPNG